MRHIVFLFLLTALLILGSQNTSYCQNEQGPILLLVQCERAIPSKVFDYEDAQKNANKFFQECMPAMNMYSYSSENDTYYYITMIENLDDIAKLSQSLNEAAMKIGKDKLKKVFAAFTDNVISLESEVYSYDKEFSYEPKEPRVKFEEFGFEQWTIVEFYPYYDEEALNACKKEIKEFF